MTSANDGEQDPDSPATATLGSNLAANTELLKLKADVRKLEQHLRTARKRRRRGLASAITGPTLFLLLYAMFWLPWFNPTVTTAISIPGFGAAIAVCTAAVYLYRNPGGPVESFFDKQTNRYHDSRRSEDELELALETTRDTKNLRVAYDILDTKTRRLLYKEEAHNDIETLRFDSKKYRNVNNFFQGSLIIGSLIATGTSAITAAIPEIRWVTFGVSLSVGIASGFMGYYKYKERSFYLQQTADSIEHEWEAYEVGVGRYKRADDDKQALEDFVAEVHRLKSEQKKRQQNLEQPPEQRSVSD